MTDANIRLKLYELSGWTGDYITKGSTPGISTLSIIPEYSTDYLLLKIKDDVQVRMATLEDENGNTLYSFGSDGLKPEGGLIVGSTPNESLIKFIIESFEQNILEKERVES